MSDETVDCRHSLHQSGNSVHCAHLSNAAGYPIGTSACRSCQQVGGADRPVAETPLLRRLLIGHLRTRLCLGDCPGAVQDGFDVHAGFALHGTLVAPDERRALLKRMFRKQAARPVGKGGDRPEVIAQKIEALAKANGMEDVLDEIRREYGNAIPG